MVNKKTTFSYSVFLQFTFEKYIVGKITGKTSLQCDCKGPSVEETQFGFPSPSQRKRVLHFASGETLEEDSSGEEDKETHSDVHTLNCGLLHVHTACDYLGEKLASLAGLNTSKYQYAVDEYHRKNKEVGKTFFFFFCPPNGLERITRALKVSGTTDSGGAAHLKSDRSAGLRAEESADAAHLQHGH
uniref:Uncharacterized protein n=1 Tax=Scleropages formosus TaxID=113540 RepID=A0A8C9R912_SCLFO